MKIDKNLDIWKKGRQSAQNVYELAKELPEEEKFILSEEITQTAILMISEIPNSSTPALQN